MVRGVKHLLLSLPLLFLPAAYAVDSSPVFFRASFDGTASATLRGVALEPVRMEKAEFAASDHSQALVAGSGTVIEYDLGDAFPAHAGSIEVRFKPGFPQQHDQPARTAFALVGADGQRLNFQFTPNGNRWQFGIEFPKWKRSVAVSNFTAAHEQKWNHLLLTWDEKSAAGPLLQFYREGRWDRHRTEPFKQNFGVLRKLVIGPDALTSLDEIVIYDRPLNESAVAFLHGKLGTPDRFAALRGHDAEEARAAKAAKDARRALVAQLKGKVAHIINPRGGTQRNFPLPEGITGIGLRVEDIGKVDLSQFAVIHGPPGANYQLTREQDEVIREYIRKGGGYVGVCAGANYAGKAKLLNMTTHSFKNQGLVSVGVQPHPVTRGFSGEVVIHHGNGPIMVPGEGCQMIGSFEIGQKFPIKTAAIVAGENGAGRVVAFGPHPNGGGVEFQEKGAKFEGHELGTDTLFVNALLWAARVTE